MMPKLEPTGSRGSQGIGRIVTGVAIGFALLAFVRPMSVMGQECFYIGNDMCLKRLHYYAAWLIALLLAGSGLMAYIRSMMQHGAAPSSPPQQSERQRVSSVSGWAIGALIIGIIIMAIVTR